MREMGQESRHSLTGAGEKNLEKLMMEIACKAHQYLSILTRSLVESGQPLRPRDQQCLDNIEK